LNRSADLIQAEILSSTRAIVKDKGKATSAAMISI